MNDLLLHYTVLVLNPNVVHLTAKEKHTTILERSIIKYIIRSNHRRNDEINKNNKFLIKDESII